MRVAYSELDVASVNLQTLVGVDAEMKAQDIELLTFDEYKAREPNWLHECWEFDWSVTQDIPMPDPPTRVPLEIFRQYLSENPLIVSDGFIVAVDGQRLTANG